MVSKQTKYLLENGTIVNMITLYNVVSKDWFIADKNGNEDFISSAYWAGTLGVFQTFPVLLIGRKTYEVLQSYEPELLVPFENLSIKKFVFTNNAEYPVKAGYTCVHHINDVLNGNANILVCSGPTLNNYLFEYSLVDQVIVHQLPVVLGEGIRTFDDQYSPLLELVSSKPQNAMTEITYEVTA